MKNKVPKRASFFRRKPFCNAHPLQKRDPGVRNKITMDLVLPTFFALLNLLAFEPAPRCRLQNYDGACFSDVFGDFCFSVVKSSTARICFKAKNAEKTSSIEISISIPARKPKFKKCKNVGKTSPIEISEQSGREPETQKCLCFL